jgi:hypothetical protein
MADRELKNGDTGSDVKIAQTLMNRVGMVLDDDGSFGSGTEEAVRECQALAGLPATGRVDAVTWTWLRAQAEPSADISTKAVTFIVQQEISSRAYYASKAARPIYPGGASGITIGVGYDLHFQSEDRFKADWGAVLNPSQLAALIPFLGRQGSAEQAHKLGAITIPWRAAWTVFIQRLLPNYVTTTRTAFGGFDRLSRHSRGALVSLVYNRGAKMDGDDRREMREIRDAVARGDFAAVPPAIIAMKRLWPNVEGLRIRRDREAELFKEGLIKAS